MTIERVEGINPAFGLRISTGYDPLAKGFDAPNLVKAINSISDTRHDYDMLMESAQFDEVDSYYNPGTEEVADNFVLEAIVVDKFSKTERRMAAIVRVLNKHLANSEIKALEAIIGKPRKTGSYAYVTVQLPFSDGQVVSVIFHAPEGDKKKIGPSDQIIAFRWLLNKRDITQVVAPEDGSEISLESLAMRITQLVVKNSARFERTQKEAQAERQELDKAREELKTAEDRQSELMASMANVAKDAESIDAKLSNTLALLEKQKAINAELQARLDAMRKTQPNAVGGENATKQTLPLIATIKSGIIRGNDTQTAIEAAQNWIDNHINGPIQTKVGEVVVDKKSIKDSLRHAMYQSKLDAIQALEQVLKNGDYLGMIGDKDSKPIDNHYFAAKVRIGDEDKIVFVRTRKAEGNPNRFYVHEVFTEDEVREKDSEGVSNTPLDGRFKSPFDFYKTVIANYLHVKTGGGDNQGSGIDTLPSRKDDDQNPPSSLGNEKGASEPDFVNSLNDIVNGAYDHDLDRIDALLDEAASQADAAGNFDQYEDLFNQAADHLTELYKKKAGAM